MSPQKLILRKILQFVCYTLKVFFTRRSEASSYNCIRRRCFFHCHFWHSLTLEKHRKEKGPFYLSDYVRNSANLLPAPGKTLSFRTDVRNLLAPRT
jgi:hypothetical protein